jgi:hypothetical protein
MILSLALRYQKHIALFLLSISFFEVTIAARISYYSGSPAVDFSYKNYGGKGGIGNAAFSFKKEKSSGTNSEPQISGVDRSNLGDAQFPLHRRGVGGGRRGEAVFIGGPTQPESQSFSSVNSNNMVDLFTGDFSYNIPLLDVGGYPVNIAYHSGITMDEEASWVGLGWNINPGSITRNMRGVPDDFNGGADTLKKVSNIKANDNWGVTVGADAELFGLQKLKNIKGDDSIVKIPSGVNIGASIGVFHNTYNGWGFERSLNASLNAGAKSFLPMSAGLSLTNNTQNGVSIQPSLSMKYSHENNKDDAGWGAGINIAAPYNSRTGLKAMQMGLNGNNWQKQKGQNGNEGVINASGGFGQLSFAWGTYTPNVSMPMTNFNNSVTVKVGDEKKGLHNSMFISGYWGSEYIAPADTAIALPVFGYLNFQNLVGNRDALTDFNREKEIVYREKPAVPHIAVPTYTYDVFSISGEGTGGSFRPYRGDIGYIADHRMRSKTTTNASSFDIGVGDAVHGGVDMNFNYSYSQNGPWESENVLGNTINFRNSQGLFEAAYFRNPSEKAINTTDFYNAIGGDDVVAPALEQRSRHSPTIIASNTLNRYRGKEKVGSILLKKDSAVRAKRDKRSQVISYLTAGEAAVVGLDKYIYHHKINSFGSRHCDDFVVDDTSRAGSGLVGYYFNNNQIKGAYRNNSPQLDPTIFFFWDNKVRPFPDFSDNYRSAPSSTVWRARPSGRFRTSTSSSSSTVRRSWARIRSSRSWPVPSTAGSRTTASKPSCRA